MFAISFWQIRFAPTTICVAAQREDDQHLVAHSPRHYLAFAISVFSFAIFAVTATAAPSLTGVAARKIHNGVPLDIVVDTTPTIAGGVTIEPRSNGVAQTLVFKFDAMVSAVGTVMVFDDSGASLAVGSPAFSGYEVIVTLPAIANRKRLTVSLLDVAQSGLNVTASIGFLVGDVTNAGIVSGISVQRTKARSAQSADQTNSRYDINTSGVVSAADISAVKARSNITNNTLLPCVPSVQDLPDPAFQDTNCDGIDGDIAKSFFVSLSGTDSNAGTMQQPFRTIAKGVAAAAADATRKTVLVSAGNYDESVVLADGVSLYGQYQPGTWSRSGTHVTIIGPSVPGLPALQVNGYAGTGAVEGFVLSVPGVTFPPGASARAVALSNVGANLAIRYNTIVAGAGAAGRNGNAGTTGANGLNGGNGSFAGNGNPFGGNSGTNPSCPLSIGGVGGSGGATGSPGAGGQSGFAPGGGGGGGGAGATLVASCFGASPSGSGGSGLNGSTSAAGSFGAASTQLGTLSGVSYVPPIAGSGATGAIGGGGGGGGGGAGTIGNFFCNPMAGSTGGGGGGGGAGGCGGGAGTGAGGGGGSIGVVAFNSSPTVSNNEIVVSTGGNGGIGGYGAAGGNGGLGGAGGAGNNVNGGSGGIGGAGANGTFGGCGAGGAGGPTVVLMSNAASAISASANRFAMGTPAAGGSPGVTGPGQQCAAGPAGLVAQSVSLP